MLIWLNVSWRIIHITSEKEFLKLMKGEIISLNLKLKNMDSEIIYFLIVS